MASMFAILDRTWITEKVFGNKRENLAIETLKLSIPLAPVQFLEDQSIPLVRPGPQGD